MFSEWWRKFTKRSYFSKTSQRWPSYNQTERVKTIHPVILKTFTVCFKFLCLLWPWLFNSVPESVQSLVVMFVFMRSNLEPRVVQQMYLEYLFCYNWMGFWRQTKGVSWDQVKPRYQVSPITDGNSASIFCRFCG